MKKTSAIAAAAAVNKSSTEIEEVYFCEHHKRNFYQIDSGRFYYNLHDWRSAPVGEEYYLWLMPIQAKAEYYNIDAKIY